MRVGRRIRTALVVSGLTVLLLGLGLRIYMGSGAEDRLAPEEVVSLPALRSPLPKTSFLACPPDYCSAAEAITSPGPSIDVKFRHENLGASGSSPPSPASAMALRPL